jgi:hypothetical protein
VSGPEVRVQAQGFAPSDTGASELADLFTSLGQDLKRQLGERYVASEIAEEPKRPRFNPQPRKPGMRKAGEH